MIMTERRNEMADKISIPRTGIPGIDVSHWQTFDKTIGMKGVREAGYQFVYIKAMDGVAEDTSLRSHLKMALDAGLMVGFYHYLRNGIGKDGTDQAMAFIKLLEEVYSPDLNKVVMLPPALDVEEYNNGTGIPRETTLQIAQWLRRVEMETARTPMLYSRQTIWSKMTTNPSWAWKYYGWVAQYTGLNLTMVPVGWDPAKVKFWQWAIARKHKWSPPPPAGIKGELDINVFLGTRPELTALAWSYLVNPPSDPAVEKPTASPPARPEKMYVLVTANEDNYKGEVFYFGEVKNL